MGKKLIWEKENTNYQCASKINLLKIEGMEYFQQADNFDYYENILRNKPIADSWIKHIKKLKFPDFTVIADENNISRINPYPSNIIKCFKSKFYLEGIALVIMWGSMTRTKNKIYTKDLDYIEKIFKEIEVIIINENRIDKAWKLLTEKLNWSNVMASKSLHFLCRSLGFEQNPPVPIDNAIVKNKIWKEFNIKIKNQRNLEAPKNWFENYSFESYNRWMTVINCWSVQLDQTTSDIETSLFVFYGNM